MVVVDGGGREWWWWWWVGGVEGGGRRRTQDGGQYSDGPKLCSVRVRSSARTAGRNAPARQVISVHVVFAGGPRPRDYEAEALTIRRPADVMTRARCGPGTVPKLCMQKLVAYEPRRAVPAESKSSGHETFLTTTHLHRRSPWALPERHARLRALRRRQRALLVHLLQLHQVVLSKTRVFPKDTTRPLYAKLQSEHSLTRDTQWVGGTHKRHQALHNTW